jgi:hypothetical protein
MSASGAHAARSRPGPVFHVNGFTKNSGVLSKRISLNPDGTVKSDGSACVMARGSGRRVTKWAEFLTREPAAVLPIQAEAAQQRRHDRLAGSMFHSVN